MLRVCDTESPFFTFYSNSAGFFHFSFPFSSRKAFSIDHDVGQCRHLAHGVTSAHFVSLSLYVYGLRPRPSSRSRAHVRYRILVRVYTRFPTISNNQFCLGTWSYVLELVHAYVRVDTF